MLLLVLFLASYIIYSNVFYTPLAGQNDLDRVYNGDQSRAYDSLSTSLTHALYSKKCDLAHIASFDGLTLEGRYPCRNM